MASWLDESVYLNVAVNKELDNIIEENLTRHTDEINCTSVGVGKHFQDFRDPNYEKAIIDNINFLKISPENELDSIIENHLNPSANASENCEVLDKRFENFQDFSKQVESSVTLDSKSVSKDNNSDSQIGLLA